MMHREAWSVSLGSHVGDLGAVSVHSGSRSINLPAYG